MSKHSSPDFAVGTEHLISSFSSYWYTTWLLIWTLLFVWAGLASYLIYHRAPPNALRAGVTWALAWVATDSGFVNVRITYTQNEQRYQGPASAFVRAEYFLERKDQVIAIARVAARDAGIVSVLLGVLGVFGLRHLGAGRRADVRLRGGYRVTARQLAKLVRRHKGASDLQVGEVPLVRGSEMQHQVLVGGPGTGKSQALRQLLMGIERRGETAVVYDPKGDLARRFYRANRGDVLLDVLDKRAPSWTPWDEIRDTADADRVAASLVPEGPNEDFWREAARSVLAGVLVCLPEARRTNCELIRLLIAGTPTEMKALLKGHPAARYFIDDSTARMRESVVGTFLPHLRGLMFLDAEARPGTFSIRTLVEMIAGSRGKRTPWIFITTRPEHAAALRGLCSAWIESAAVALFALGPDRARRVHYVLDEFPTLPKLDIVQKLMAVGRGYGGCVTLALQDISQIRSTYGHNQTETISAQIATKMIFRLNDSTSAEWGSKELGAAEISEHTESQGIGGEKTGGGQFSNHRAERRVVTPAEISALPDLRLYVKLQGLPVAEVRLKVDEVPDQATAFVARDPALRVETALRQVLAGAELEDTTGGPL